MALVMFAEPDDHRVPEALTSTPAARSVDEPQFVPAVIDGAMTVVELAVGRWVEHAKAWDPDTAAFVAAELCADPRREWLFDWNDPREQA